MIRSLEGGQVVIRASRAKIGVLAPVGAAMTLLGVYLIRNGSTDYERLVGWGAALAFGFCSAVVPVELLKPTTVTLAPDGLTIRTAFKTFRSPWSEFKSFQITSLGRSAFTKWAGVRTVTFRFKDGSGKRTRLSDFNRANFDIDGSFPTTLAISNGRLLQLATEALSRWGSCDDAGRGPGSAQLVTGSGPELRFPPK